MTSSDGMRIGVVVLGFNRPGVTRTTVDAILTQDPPADVLVLVDQGVNADVSAVLADGASRHPAGRVLRLNQNLGAAGGFEAGMATLLADDDVGFVCCFDDDATPEPGCLGSLREAALSLPRAGEVGAVSHDGTGKLAWPLPLVGDKKVLRTVEDVRSEAAGRAGIEVAGLAWHGLMFPAEVLRRHGVAWGALFINYDDNEIAMRLRRAGLRCYVVPEAECRHPAEAFSEISVFGHRLAITRQEPWKEYLRLRNGLVVFHLHGGHRFWWRTGPLVLVRGLITSVTIASPLLTALRYVFLQAVIDAIRGRLGPPPPELLELSGK